MQKYLLSLLFLLAPSVAMAHPGHQHVGGEINHHLFEFAGIAVAAGLMFWMARRFLGKRAAQKIS